MPVLVPRYRSQNTCTSCILWAFEPAFSLHHSSIFHSPGLRNSGACGLLARPASGSGIQVQMFLGSNFSCLLDVHVYRVYLSRG